MTKRIDKALRKALDSRGHPLVETCHIGPEAALRLARHVRDAWGARRVMVVSDANTLAASEEAVHKELRDAGCRLVHKDFGPEPLEATDTLGDAVAEAAGSTDALAAVGSGTLCDLAKHAGTKLGKPVALYATAASMNGYTSGITAVKVRGLKRTMPCVPATAVFAEPRLLAAAPARMTAAGLADYLSKCSSGADWATAHFLRGEYYFPGALQFYEGILDEVFASAEDIGRGEPESVALLFEALVLSGLSMLVAGSSSPASGGEHLLSHYCDMWSAVRGTPHDLHGAQVGVGTLACLDLWARVLEMDPRAIDPAALAHAHPSPADVAALVREDWPEPVAGEVLAQWREKAPSPEPLREELARVRDGHAALYEHARRDYRPAETVRNAIRAAGGPVDPGELTVPPEVFQRALARARFIRNRFTVLDLAAELGLGANPET
jgi:glycerol-1-phosphate dehydrogenase [NAD(P)+]